MTDRYMPVATSLAPGSIASAGQRAAMCWRRRTMALLPTLAAAVLVHALGWCCRTASAQTWPPTYFITDAQEPAPMAPSGQQTPSNAASQAPASGQQSTPEAAASDSTTAEPPPWTYCPDSYYRPFERVWMRGEYLLWWTRSLDIPTLATTSTDGTPVAEAGVLGLPTTQVLLGPRGTSLGDHSGGRWTLGFWGDPACQNRGIQASYLHLSETSAEFSADQSDHPILAAPIFNVQTGLQDSVLIAYPNLSDGSLAIRWANQLQSFDIAARRLLVVERGFRLDCLLGYREADFDETIRINAETVFTDPDGEVQVGTVISGFDLFDVDNQFHGVDIGLASQMWRNGWLLDLEATLALGNTESQAVVAGSTTTTVPQQIPEIGPGSIYALPTNIGTYEEDRFSILPEISATIGYQLTRRLRATVGYTFLLWTRVSRPGALIDTSINTSQFPPGELDGEPAPRFHFARTDFWAQGISFGLDYRF